MLPTQEECSGDSERCETEYETDGRPAHRFGDVPEDGSLQKTKEKNIIIKLYRQRKSFRLIVKHVMYKQYNKQYRLQMQMISRLGQSLALK